MKPFGHVVMLLGMLVLALSAAAVAGPSPSLSAVPTLADAVRFMAMKGEEGTGGGPTSGSAAENDKAFVGTFAAPALVTRWSTAKRRFAADPPAAAAAMADIIGVAEEAVQALAAPGTGSARLDGLARLLPLLLNSREELQLVREMVPELVYSGASRALTAQVLVYLTRRQGLFQRGGAFPPLDPALLKAERLRLLSRAAAHFPGLASETAAVAAAEAALARARAERGRRGLASKGRRGAGCRVFGTR